MSSLAFLVTELQSLASETRRKHPEVREAAEKSLAILRSSPEQATASLASDGPQAEDLLRPVFMGCSTKNAKIVGISVGSLQRLISLKAVPASAVPLIVNTMSDCISQGVDIQLRILQTLLSLITNFPQVHGPLLGDALLLCFKLHESRIVVVSSTAAATLRQLVMFVVDKVVDEDRRKDSIKPEKLTETTLPDGTSVSLGPSAHDAFAVFQDLCLLANSEKPVFLRLESLPRTFGLELIESVVTNYHELFRTHPELLILLRHNLTPVLLRSLSDRPTFPLNLRATRVVFLLLKQFSNELVAETEVFFSLLVRAVGTETPAEPSPPWLRVLSLEIVRGLCGDAALMRATWARHDAAGAPVFAELVAALARLVTEKPGALGVGTQMLGVGVVAPAQDPGASPLIGGYGIDMGGMAGKVANVASATVSGVVGMIASGPGLSVPGSSMKVQCIDQLDKADAPPIPDTYIYLLGVQCLISLSEGFASFAAPIYTSIMVQRPRAAGDSLVRAPAALDVSALPQDDPQAPELRSVQEMVEHAWPALLAALSFIIGTNLSDSLFADVLSALQALTNVAGMLGQSTPRDAFFAQLAKCAIPPGLVASVDSHMEPSTPRTASSTLSEGLGLTAPAQAPGLSERNAACLKALTSSAVFLAGSLGPSWFSVLEALQNADYVLTLRGMRARPATGKQAAPGQPPAPRHPLLTDLDVDNLQAAIQRLFDTSRNLEDGAFTDFVGALCKLSAEMVGMQLTFGIAPPESPNDETGLSSGRSLVQRRRVSGIHLPRTLRSGDFGINKLGGVALLNVHRLIYRSPDVAWNVIVTHLLSVVRSSMVPAGIRVQGAQVLDEILVVIPRNLTSVIDTKEEVQNRMLDALAQQVITSESSSTSVEIRRMGLETLHQILQASAHTLLVGWETIFEILASVCKPAPGARLSSIDLAFPSPFPSPSPALLTSPSTYGSPYPSSGGSPRLNKPPPLGYVNEKAYTTLVKIAFQSLKLVCDSLASLSPEHLQLCISTLGAFGRQADTNIALTAAESLLWGVSDSIQAKRRDSSHEDEHSALWMFLLQEVLGLCTDARPEVRVGAIQTLFRTMTLYGATLTLQTWDDCVWKIMFPLLDGLATAVRQSGAFPVEDGQDHPAPDEWDESLILAIQSTGGIFSDFLASNLVRLDSFEKAWDAFVEHVRDTVLSHSRKISAPALNALDKAIKASAGAGSPEQRDHVWRRAWSACGSVGAAVAENMDQPRTPSGQDRPPFSQESLVALVDVIRSTRQLSMEGTKDEWPLERLSRLMEIFKGVLTYTRSSDYRPDVESLPPLQKAVVDAVSGIGLQDPSTASLVLHDMSEYATLAFLAAFDIPEPTMPAPAQPTAPRSGAPRKRVTYIALTKKMIPAIVDVYLEHKHVLNVYSDGTFEEILTAFSIPIKLKYDCPPPSRYNKEPPLWKTATKSFLKVVKESIVEIKTVEPDLPDGRLDRIWRQILDVYRGVIMADCSAAEDFDLEIQEEEENFDLAVLASLEIDILPHLGDPRVPASLLAHLAKVLQDGSRLHEHDGDDDEAKSQDTDKSQTATLYHPEEPAETTYGTTAAAIVVPRERFSYWCFDLLFLMCSDTAKGQERDRRRVAALSIPALLARCQSTLLSFVADESLRGNLPFPRVREEELLYVLRKLLELRLWPGSLWAAFSDSPATYYLDQPGIDPGLAPAQVVADAVRRSTKAHLFQLYPVLCEIASIPRRGTAVWVQKESGHAEKLDARTLARDCLKEIARELGMAA